MRVEDLSYQERYRECIRMLNGLEKALEQQIDPSSRRWRSRDSDPPISKAPEL
jgi:hypothetical protein